MRRLPGGLAFAILCLMLAGCASGPKGRDSGFYDAPARAYTLNLDSQAFRGKVILSEQCDATGGTLNVWDSSSNFFRIDYLKINKSPLAQIHAFANGRTITDIVLAGYMSRVMPNATKVDRSEVLFKDFVNTKRGNALLSIVNLHVKDSALPEGVTENNYYYAVLIFQKGDCAYIVQNRSDSFQPDRLKNLLVALAMDMTIPGNDRSDALNNPAIEASGHTSLLGSILGTNVPPDTTVKCN
jgi:hypothetical protein